jgi:hypothetical protein
MYKNTLLFAFLLTAFAGFSQEQTPELNLKPKREQETLFRNAHLRGGFGGPMFSWSKNSGKVGFGAGGGGGLVFDRVFVGLFGMGETFDKLKIGEDQLTLGYGGLWVGYTYPSHKLLHLYTSVKIGGGSVAITNFTDDFEASDDWLNATFVAVPEAGLELNVAKWMRIGGTVGYRFVNGFDGWGSYGKNDLNALTYGFTLRFGWF